MSDALAPGSSTPAAPRAPGALEAFLRLFARNRLAAFGSVVLGLVVLIVLLAPVLPLPDPYAQDTPNKFLRPLSPGHLLGTDHLGRDILSRLVWGTQTSLAVGAAAALISATLGSAIGILAGFYGGRTDNLLMRAIDMLMAFPYILLALAIVAALGPGLLNALIAVAIVNIPFFARNIRGVTVGLAHREFVDAARLAGQSNLQIVLTEILPNVLPVIVIAMSTTIGWMILETAGLSFLGLGAQPPAPDLGAMLGQGRNALITDTHAAAIPGVMIFVIVMSVNLIGDGVRDALDPRLRAGALMRPMARTQIERARQVPAAPAQPALLDIQELRTEFRLGTRALKALSGVTLAVSPGECLGVVGESGSGKSVTALSVMGLVASPPGVITGGAVRYQGEDLLGVPFERLRSLRGDRIAYIFQDPLATLHPLYRVGDQIVEAIQVHRRVPQAEARARARELLRAVRIPNAEQRMANYPHELSGGMRQRVGIAMALVNDPDLIIADEPTTALDVTVQAQILALLADLRRERDVAILFITHDFGVIGQFCDRVAVMYAGRIVEQGPTAAVLDAPAHPYTKRLIACVPELGGGRRELAAIPGLPPAVDRLPDGCAFAPRCHKATDACRQGEITLDAIAEARWVRCLYPEIEPAAEAARA
ncbi:MAG: dipeptide/oligopeptide/nickel ABC transporter permease/ATP-binding protein [Geminicoccaceae bacterium]